MLNCLGSIAKEFTMKSLKTLVTLFFLLSMPLLASISEISSFKELTTLSSEVGPQSLVVFDVDLVLVQPKDPAFQQKNYHNHRRDLRPLLAPLNETEKDLMLNLFACDDNVLVEHETPSFIKQIQEQQAKTLGLTASLSKENGPIPNFAHYRYDNLHSHGINFSQSFEQDDCLYPELGEKYGAHPCFYKGILFCNSDAVDKGVLLVHFLKEASWLPQEVIFFDDSLSNLENVQEHLTKHHPEVRFQGFHYKGAEHYDDGTPILDFSKIQEKWQERIKVAQRLTEKYKSAAAL